MDWGPYALALIGIGGTVLAGYLTHQWERQAQRQTELERRQHEDETRWLIQRREIYARFLAAADALELPAAGEINRQATIEFDPAAETDRIIRAHTELDLVASPDVRHAALVLHMVTIIVMQAALTRRQGGRVDGDGGQQDFAKERAAFVDVRKDRPRPGESGIVSARVAEYTLSGGAREEAKAADRLVGRQSRPGEGMSCSGRYVPMGTSAVLSFVNC